MNIVLVVNLFLCVSLFSSFLKPLQVLPIVIYFSSVVSVIYYLGAMQVIIVKLAWLMQKTMATSAGESLNAAGNIFIGQVGVWLYLGLYILSHLALLLCLRVQHPHIFL